MPQTFKSICSNLSSTSLTSLYTVASSTTAIVKSLYIGNVDASNSSTIDVCIRKSGGGADVYIIKTALVPIQSSLQVITEPIVLEDGDVLKVKAADSNRLDVSLSYLEIT